MNRRAYANPGAQAAMQAKAGIVVASLFLVFGLGFAFVVLRETEGELVFLIGGFFLIWIVACVSIIVFYANLLSKRKKGAEGALVDFYFEKDADTPETGGEDFETRLRKLERLKQDGLITEQEYRDKRADILQEKW